MKAQFTQLSRAWYGDATLKGYEESGSRVKEEIMIGLYDTEGGGTSGEFALRWIRLENESAPAMRLEVFDDALEVFASQFTDLLRELAYMSVNRPPTPEEVRRKLIDLRIEDATKTERPDIV